MEVDSKKDIRQVDITDKGLSIRSEEVQEMMGEIPHWIMRRGMFLLSFIVVLLSIGSYFFRFPSYVELNYVVKDGTLSVNIIATSDGVVRYIQSETSAVDVGDTIAVVDGQGINTYYVSPTKGLFENNFLYSSGEQIQKGDTLSRILASCTHEQKVLLYIPRDLIPKVTIGMEVKLYGSSTDFVKGNIFDIARIPDNLGNYLTRLKISTSSENLLSSGKAKLMIDNKRLIEFFLP